MGDLESRDPFLEDLVRVIRRGFVPALLVAILGAAGMYYLNRLQSPVFESQVALLATPVDSGLAAFGVSSISSRPLSANAYGIAAVSTPVLRDALAALGVESPSALDVENFRRSITVRTEVEPASTIIHIRASDTDPRTATLKAGAVADALLAWDAARAQGDLSLVVSTLTEQVALLSNQLESLDPNAEDYQNQRSGLAALRTQQQTQLASARALLSSAVGVLEVLEPAEVPMEPVAPRPVRNATITFVLGMFLVYGILLVRDAVSTRIRSSEELEWLTGAPTLVSLARQPRKADRLPREAANYLCTNLLYVTADHDPKVLLVTSSRSGEGASRVARGIAEGFARRGHRTLLVDANLRNPSVATAYSAPTKGPHSLNLHLRLAASGGTVPGEAGVIRYHDLDIVTATAELSSPVELLTRGFGERLAEWRSRYEIIVIDTAPLSEYADALTIAPLCTGTVLVVDTGMVDRRQARRVMGLLGRLEVRLLGTVMTGATPAELHQQGAEARGPSTPIPARSQA